MEVARIANCSGFYGDRRAAAREMVEDGPIDYLTGDYLAELTMAVLWRTRHRDPGGGGYARTFLQQMEEVLGTCLDRGIRVVANAGGLDPLGLRRHLQELAGRLGLQARVAAVTGDDMMGRLADLEAPIRPGPADGEPVTANAYLGCWGITSALQAGADVVVTGRVTDAALVMGPAAHAFNWAPDDWDRLAGALAAGHIIECGAQATGGNFSFFREVPGLDHPGFPLVEMHADGTFVVTKHPGTGGMVSNETVTAQLLYEIAGPRYLSPDVTARFDTIRLQETGPDRVRVEGTVGEPPPDTLKVALNHRGGYRNRVTFVLTGLDIEQKAVAVEEALWRSLGGQDSLAVADVRLLRWDRPDPLSNEEAMAQLRITVQDPDPTRVGRRFSGAAVELALSSIPGLFLTAPPSDASPYVIYRDARVPARLVPAVVHVGDETWTVDSPATRQSPAPEEAGVEPPLPDAGPGGGDTVEAPLGAVAGTRSGDKGGDANVGVWVRRPEAYPWLVRTLTVARLRDLVPEAARLDVERWLLPNLGAVNFVVRGLLGDGAAASVRVDPQAKSLGEYLRSRRLQIPAGLLPPEGP
ncbi:MAG: acyclic terpene utilization AtuA family protein [Actinomycetota bacterium]